MIGMRVCTYGICSRDKCCMGSPKAGVHVNLSYKRLTTGRTRMARENGAPKELWPRSAVWRWFECVNARKMCEELMVGCLRVKACGFLNQFIRFKVVLIYLGTLYSAHIYVVT